MSIHFDKEDDAGVVRNKQVKYMVYNDKLVSRCVMDGVDAIGYKAGNETGDDLYDTIFAEGGYLLKTLIYTPSIYENAVWYPKQAVKVSTTSSINQNIGYFADVKYYGDCCVFCPHPNVLGSIIKASLVDDNGNAYITINAGGISLSGLTNYAVKIDIYNNNKELIISNQSDSDVIVEIVPDYTFVPFEYDTYSPSGILNIDLRKADGTYISKGKYIDLSKVLKPLHWEFVFKNAGSLTIYRDGTYRGLPLATGG